MISKTTLISYALSFVSFLVDSTVGKNIDKVILFGSVARGDFSPASDIDLFIDTNERWEKDIEKVLSLYQQSQAAKTWYIKGVRQEFSLKVGKLQEWSLRREVISSGIMLYGKYEELPKNMHYYALIRLEIGPKQVAEQVRIWRKLYGYRQSIGKKRYESPGLLTEVGGKRLGKGMMLIPMARRQILLSFLNKNRVKYTINEVWSDTI